MKIPLSVGWQLIHAYLVSEGSERKWRSAVRGGSTKFKDWRKNIQPYNPDIE